MPRKNGYQREGLTQHNDSEFWIEQRIKNIQSNRNDADTHENRPYFVDIYNIVSKHFKTNISPSFWCNQDPFDSVCF